MPSLRILILYNEPVLPAEHPDFASEHEIVETASFVAQALSRRDFEIAQFGLGRDLQRLVELAHTFRPDAIFNLFENSETEAEVAETIELLGIPFTGCPAVAIRTARLKHVAKTMLQQCGLPTPRFLSVDKDSVPVWNHASPAIVKPAAQDGSLGLDHGSVVTNQDRLVQRVRHLLGVYGPPVLIEEFIEGRELNVGLIESPTLRTLPHAEILFHAREAGYWSILTYDAKWKTGCKDDLATPRVCPAEVAPELALELEDLAKRAFRLLSCRDYVRVDFRVSPAGRPYILEVNPNPDFHPAAGLASALQAAGISHEQCAIDLVERALARRTNPSNDILPAGNIKIGS